MNVLRGWTIKVLLILLVLCLLHSGQSLDRFNVVLASIDDQIEQKGDELEKRKSELEESEARQFQYQQEGLTLSERLTALGTDIEAMRAELAENEQKRLDAERKVAELEELVRTTQSNLTGASRTLYKRSRTSLVDLIFSSKGLSAVIRQMGFHRFGLSHMVSQLKEHSAQQAQAAAEYNVLSSDILALQSNAEELSGQMAVLEAEKAVYERLAAEETQRQQSLAGQIANITAEQEALIAEKMRATQESTSIGEYEDSATSLPFPPFSQAFAVVSIGYPHRVGLSQYGAYGRAKAGQDYRQILMAYYNADFVESYPAMDQISVVGYGSMSFEDQYLKGIAEMPTSWGDSGGYEALKAQAVIARSYAIAFTQNGALSICMTQDCQVYNHSKAFDPAAARWHQAVAETRGQVLTSGGVVISAYYASTAGGYTRLPTDFDVGWSYNPSFLKRIADVDGEGRAYEGPSYGNSPWYYKAWYDPAVDVHPWLTQEEMLDLLNAALLPESYNPYLSAPAYGGWTAGRVREELSSLGIVPIDGITGIVVLNSSEGYSATVRVVAPSGSRDVDGRRFNSVFKLRSRGHLALWSSLYDIVVR
ncbi:MAG: SpoIID/LytB domain-containing protein [Candidatus Dojkabacteria bacterium]|nr:SpoIID/LytB domain-containing protein [Candidatus Dojkabacteria bacterium]